MDPSVWGSCLWKTLHTIAMGYPNKPTVEDMTAYTQFYENFWKVLPCKNPCSLNYRRHLKELPLDNFLRDNKTLFEWTVILHNVVNEELGKKYISLDEAKVLYSPKIQQTQKCTFQKNTLYAWLLISIIILLFMYILWDKSPYIFLKTMRKI